MDRRRHGGDKQSVIFARVQPRQRGRSISAQAVGREPLAIQQAVQVQPREFVLCHAHSSMNWPAEIVPHCGLGTRDCEMKWCPYGPTHWVLACFTASTKARALAVMVAQSPFAIGSLLTSADPAPTNTARS